MNRMSLICYGKMKSKDFQNSVDEFVGRISQYCPIEVFILKAEKIEEKSSAVRAQLKEKEANSFFELIDSKAFKQHAGQSPVFWVLDETGKSLSTQEWADQFKLLALQGQGSLALVIGGSLGLSELVRKKGAKLISFGKQTMNHELTRVVATEQIYRAFTVIHGHPYHNS